MPRPHTGALSIENSQRLTIKSLQEAGMLQKGKVIEGTAEGGRGSMLLRMDWKGAQPVLWLSYSYKGAHQYYSIHIEERRSNLGRGSVLYFVCPESYRRTRTLYMAYNYPRYKAREAYSIRLYYPSQLAGGRSRYNTRYFQIEEQLESMYDRRQYLTHKEQPTRRAIRQQMLEDRLRKYDILRWTVGMPAALSRLMS